MIRFFRRVKILPGVRLGFSRSGVSTSVGPRGAHVTVGPHGASAYAGLNGSGISMRHDIHVPRGLTESPPPIHVLARQPHRAGWGLIALLVTAWALIMSLIFLSLTDEGSKPHASVSYFSSR